MKKSIVLLFSVIALSSAKAQIQFGVKAGLNLTNLSISSDISGTNDISSKTSFNAGVLAYIPISAPLYLQPEINYSAQGAKETFQGTNIDINYDYINVPVLVKYAHSSGLFAETGPQAGFLISAKAKSGGNSEDIKDGVQSFDFSWAVGVGYKIPDINLGIDVRYNIGITNTIKDAPSGSSAKNSVFQFGIFYLFGGGAE